MTHTWEQRKLGELGTITTGSTPSTAIPDYYSDDGIVWVTPTDICENITFESARKLSDLGQQVGRVVPKNTILVTGIASIGKNTMLGNAGSFNQQINGLTPNENECDPYFLLTESALWSAKMKSSAAAGTMQIVNRTEFSELKTWLPSLIEQQAISDFFRQLDNLITLHQRKLDKLHKVKRSLLERMFPRNGANVPEIRFSGFTDAWEQRKLGEISESFEYGLNAAATEYDGKHKYIRITDIDDSTHLFLQDDLTSPDIDFSTADDYLLQEGDVLFARTGASVGKTYIYRRSDGDLYFAGFLIRAKIKSDYDADFVFQNTLTDSYDSYIRITSQRSGQPGVNAQEYANFALSVPSLAEQKKIGAYFSHLDSLITLHQRKCNYQKKGKKIEPRPILDSVLA